MHKESVKNFDPRLASSLVDIVRWRAINQPSKLAYIWLADGEHETERWTYADLDMKARAIAATLLNHAPIGSRLLLIYPPGLEFIAAFLGSLYAGMVAVPLSPIRDKSNHAHLKRLAVDCAPSLLLTSATLFNTREDQLRNLLLEMKLPFILTDEISSTLASEWREVGVQKGLAMIQYTSGSTSLPRGVMISHENLIHNEELIRSAFNVKSSSVIAGWLPLYHDMGLIGTALQPLYSGAHAILMAPQSFIQRPLRWLQSISKYRVTISGGPNFAYDLCTRKIQPDEQINLNLSSWTVAFNGAEPVRASTLREFTYKFSVSEFSPKAWHPCFGLAESTLLVSVNNNHKEDVESLIKSFDEEALGQFKIIGTQDGRGKREVVSCGRPVGDQEIIVVSPDRLELCGSEEIGEIWIRGKSVANGYWSSKAEENTERDGFTAFNANFNGSEDGGYLRTGDLGFLYAGELFITGRIKDLIIQHGRNYYPQDIELSVERAHPAINPAGCGAFSYEEAGMEAVGIVCEVNRHKSFNADELISRIREVVFSEHELKLSAVVLLKQGYLPRTTSGKVRRSVCSKLIDSNDSSILSIWRTSSEVIAQNQRTSTNDPMALLISECARVLEMEIDKISPNQQLTRFGLDSIKAIELAHIIEERLGIPFPASRMLEGCTISEIIAESRHVRKNVESVPVRKEVSSENMARLSKNQESLYFLYKLSPESSQYNISVVAKLNGQLDQSALLSAFENIARKEEGLRTTFKLDEGVPTQIIHNAPSIDIVELDAFDWNEEELNKRLKEEALRPFSLEIAPPWRVRLFKRSEAEHILSLTVHHILVDLWSFTIWLEELIREYREEELSSSLRKSSYIDFVRWQSGWIESDEGKEAGARTVSRLKAEWPVVNLQLGLPTNKDEMQSRKVISLGNELSEQVKRFSKVHGVTSYVVLLSAFEALLGRYTSLKHFTIGSPSANRSEAAFSNLIGYFVNPIVLRANLEGLPDFKTLIERTKKEALEAFRDEAYPFSMLVESLHPERRIDQSPLFNVMFVMQSTTGSYSKDLTGFTMGIAGSRIHLGSISMESIDFDPGINLYDLVLTAGETRDGILLSLQYKSNQLTEEAAERFLVHYQRLLKAGMETPTCPIEELPILTSEELNRQFKEWNSCDIKENSLPAVNESIIRLFERRVDKNPDSIAITFETESLTYRELNHKANRLAHYLHKRGVKQETSVALCLDRSIDLIVAIVAVLKAGGAYVPIDPSYPKERIDFILKDIDTKFILTNSSSVTANVSAKESISIIYLDKENEEISQMPGVNLSLPVDLNSLAYVIYTSGSTGRPKGCLVTHRNIARLFEVTEPHFHFNEEDVWTLFHSYAFDFSVWEIWGALLYGGRVVIVPYWTSRSPQEFLKLLNNESVTILNQTPTSLRHLLNTSNDNLPKSIRKVICGGEELEPQVVKAWFANRISKTADLINMYGITEITVHGTYTRITEEELYSSRLHTAIGRPLSDLKIYILDDALQPLPAAIPGEIFVAGDGLSRGYHHRGGLTAERFIPDPFDTESSGARMYRSGDIGRYLSNGEIEYLGRKDYQVQLHGFRIEPAEIETALQSYTGIQQAVVATRRRKSKASLRASSPKDEYRIRVANYRHYLKFKLLQADDAGTEPVLVAFIVPAPEHRVNVDELRRYLIDKLPVHMVPSAYVILDSLPTTSSGKLNRSALPELTESGITSSNSINTYTAPHSWVEKELCKIWSILLGVGQVGIDDNFFTLGGDSIRAIRLVAEAGIVGINLSVESIFRYQTIRNIAMHCGEQVKRESYHPLLPFSLINSADRECIPDNVVDAYPLTHMQAGLIYHSDQHARSSIYRASFLYRLSGELNQEKFRLAIGQTLDHHPILRTSFDLVSFSRPLQLVHENIAPHIEFIDLSSYTEQEQERELECWFTKERESDFALWKPSLIRFSVHSLNSGTFTLGITCHDAILDGWSTATIITEILTRYSSLLNGINIPVEQTSVGYKDFVALEGSTLESDEHINYWKKKLSSIDENGRYLLSNQSNSQMPNLRVVDVNIGSLLSDRLKSFAMDMGVPVKSILLAAHLRVLQLLTGQEQVITGLEMNGRLEVLDGERAVGQHLNTVPFIQTLKGGTWKDLINHTFSNEQELMPFRRLPYAEIQKLVGGQPLYDTTFNYTHFHVFREVEQLKHISVVDGQGRELTHYLLKTEFNRDAFTDNLTLDVIYDNSRISDEEVVKIGHYYLKALESIVDSPLDQYEYSELLSEVERNQVIEWFNSTKVKIPKQSLHELIEIQIQKHPNHTAVSFEGSNLTYKDLGIRSNQLARYLKRKGVGAESLVGLYMDRSIELSIALLGILKAGGCFVPLDTTYPPDRINYMIKDSGMQVLLTQERTWNHLSKESLEVVCLDTEWDKIALESEEPLASVTYPDNAAYLIYTSGSTGKPKGAINTHQAICNRLLWMQSSYMLDTDDKILQKTPVSFDVSVWELFWPLIAGTTLVMARPGGHQDCAYLIDTIIREQITTLHFVPSLLRVFLEEENVDQCRSLRRIICSGEELTIDLQDRLFSRLNAELHNLYGPTEAAIDVTAWACSRDQLQRSSIPIGRPIQNVKIYILDKHLIPSPIGVPGELYIGGISIARGYHLKPALTAERFLPNSFSKIPGERIYRTGDIAKWLPDGNIEFYGRSDQQLKIRGVRIEPGEIQLALQEHEGVKHAIVIARKDKGGRKHLVGYVVPESIVSINEVELRNFLQSKLPSYFVPSFLMLLDRLPTTLNGKLDTSGLPDPFEERDIELQLPNLLEQIEQLSEEEVRELLQTIE